MLQAYSQLNQVLNFFQSSAFLISVNHDKFTVVDLNEKLKAESKRDHKFKEQEDLEDFLKVTFKFDKAAVSLFIKKLKTSDFADVIEFNFDNKLYKFECKPLNLEDRNFIFVAFESHQNEIQNYPTSGVQFFKNVFDSLPIGISVNTVDDSKTLYVNSKFSKIYGWDFEDLKDVTTFFEKVYPDKHVREEVKEMILSDIASGDPKRMNWENITITTKKGKRRIVNAKNIPLYNQNLMISTVTDVTKNHRIQKEIEKSKIRFDLAARASSDAVWEWNLSENELYWGDGYKRLFGYNSKNNKVSKAFWESKIHPNDVDSFSESLNEALKDKQVSKWTFDYRFRDSQKNYVNVRENLIIVRDDNGEAIKLVGALQDITKPLKRENHLNFLEKLVDGTKDAILVTEVKSTSFLESEIVYVNSSFQSLFGFDAVQVLEKTPKEFFVTPKNEEAFVKLETELSQWNSVDADILCYTKNDIEFWNNLSITPIVNDEGWYTHWMVVNRNVNELKTGFYKKELLAFTHRTFQSIDSTERVLCKISLKIEGLVGTEFCEFWLVNQYSDELSKSLRFKKGESVNRDSELLDYRSQDFANEVFKTDESKLLIHESESHSEEKNNIKLSYGFQIRSHDKCLGVVILGFRDTYSREETLDSIFEEFSIQLANEISRKRTKKDMTVFFENTPEFLGIAGKNGYLKKINSRASEILGYSNEFFLTTPFSNFIKEDDREKAFELLNKAREHKEYVTDEISVVAQNSEQLLMDWTVFSLEGGDDVFCVGRDITAKKENLSQLKTEIEKFKILAETVKDAVWDFDVIKKQITWGKGLKTLFGYDPDDFGIAEEVWLEKIHPADRKRVKDSFYSSLQKTEENEWREEYQLKNQTGTYKYVLDRGTIIRDENGKVIRMVGSLQDISEYRHYQKTLESLNTKLITQAKTLTRSNKDLEEFAYIASHDLQEPLRMITGFLTRLEEKYKDNLDDKAKEYITFAVDGSKRMRQIINGLLNFSKVGRQKLTPEKVDVKLVIEKVEFLLKEAIKEKNAKIETGDLPVIFFVEDELKEVFLNLIENSIKYAHHDVAPLIEIDYKESRNHHIFSVKDNGIGIPEEQFEKIFEVFQRLHAPGEYSETGIGLAIVKKIINNLGGEISLESKLDEGTTFLIQLPKKVLKK